MSDRPALVIPADLFWHKPSIVLPCGCVAFDGGVHAMGEDVVCGFELGLCEHHMLRFDAELFGGGDPDSHFPAKLAAWVAER